MRVMGRGPSRSRTDLDIVDRNGARQHFSAVRETERSMYKSLALYPPPEDPQAFREHYERTHLPLVSKLPGLRAFRYSFDVSAPEGESPYFAVSEAEWDSAEALDEALSTPEGQAAIADLRSIVPPGFVLVGYTAREA
jgi:uncharacterized protein (TIGR02118 family)